MNCKWVIEVDCGASKKLKFFLLDLHWCNDMMLQSAFSCLSFWLRLDYLNKFFLNWMIYIIWNLIKMYCPLQKQSVRQSDSHHLVKINKSKQENIANTKISRITCTIFNSNLPAPCIILYKFLPNTMEFFHKNLNSVLILNGLYLLQKLVINYYWASCT